MPAGRAGLGRVCHDGRVATMAGGRAPPGPLPARPTVTWGAKLCRAVTVVHASGGQARSRGFGAHPWRDYDGSPCYYSSSGKAAVLANERAVPTCWVWLKSLEGRLNVGSHALADEACYDKELHSHVCPPSCCRCKSLDMNQGGRRSKQTRLYSNIGNGGGWHVRP